MAHIISTTLRHDPRERVLDLLLLIEIVARECQFIGLFGLNRSSTPRLFSGPPPAEPQFPESYDRLSQPIQCVLMQDTTRV